MKGRPATSSRQVVTVIKLNLFSPWCLDNGFRIWRIRLLATVLACFLTASSTERACAQSATRLQPLLNDTVVQLKLVYRHDANELHDRYLQVSKALELWRAADRGEENNRRLEAWLRGAIRSSMPGSHEPLPPPPEFERLPTVPTPIVREIERSMIPTASSQETPAPTMSRPTLTAPTAVPGTDRPQVPADGPVAVEQARDTITNETASGEKAASDNERANDEPPPGNEATADDFPDVDKLPEIDEMPDLPAADELPPLDDAELTEALGDPFVDDPEPAE